MLVNLLLNFQNPNLRKSVDNLDKLYNFMFGIIMLLILAQFLYANNNNNVKVIQVTLL